MGGGRSTPMRGGRWRPTGGRRTSAPRSHRTRALLVVRRAVLPQDMTDMLHSVSTILQNQQYKSKLREFADKIFEKENFQYGIRWDWRRTPVAATNAGAGQGSPGQESSEQAPPVDHANAEERGDNSGEAPLRDDLASIAARSLGMLRMNDD